MLISIATFLQAWGAIHDNEDIGLQDIKHLFSKPSSNISDSTLEDARTLFFPSTGKIVSDIYSQVIEQAEHSIDKFPYSEYPQGDKEADINQLNAYKKDQKDCDQPGRRTIDEQLQKTPEENMKIISNIVFSSFNFNKIHGNNGTATVITGQPCKSYYDCSDH